MLFESKADKALKLSTETANRIAVLSEKIHQIVNSEAQDLDKLTDIYEVFFQITKDVRYAQALVGAEQAFAAVGWRGNRGRS